MILNYYYHVLLVPGTRYTTLYCYRYIPLTNTQYGGSGKTGDCELSDAQAQPNPSGQKQLDDLQQQLQQLTAKRDDLSQQLSDAQVQTNPSGTLPIHLCPRPPPCQLLQRLRSISHYTWLVSTHLHTYTLMATTKLRRGFSGSNSRLTTQRSQTSDCWITPFNLQCSRIAWALLP